MDMYGNKQSADVQRYIEEVVELNKKYGLSISHEDSHGCFQITNNNEFLDDWFKKAIDKKNKKNNRS